MHIDEPPSNDQSMCISVPARASRLIDHRHVEVRSFYPEQRGVEEACIVLVQRNSCRTVNPERELSFLRRKALWLEAAMPNERGRHAIHPDV